MKQSDYRVDIVGDGLAGRLVFTALKWRWPDLDLKLIRSHAPRTTSPTWCFHESDVRTDSWTWLRRYVSKSWDGYDVLFPSHRRTLHSKYHSIQSHSFFQQTDNDISSGFLDSPREAVDLAIDCTGWPATTVDADIGWQKFVGLDLTLQEPHGLEHPILKDATVPQIDGYRFFYCLPWSETSLLVEDTYYSNSPDIHIEALRKEILTYADARGWRVKSIDRQETGSLPLALSSRDFQISETKTSIRIGAASGLAHPVTGYTTPILFRQIEALVGNSASEVFDIESLKHRLDVENIQIKKGFSYFHLLNRMLFRAAVPSQRFKVLERFYHLNSELISRFYSARLTAFDRARILIGRPPVSVWNALRVLSSRR